MDRRRRISLAYRDAVLATNPVAYWRLGEASGTVARDEIGANNGTYVGSPTLGVAGLLSGDPNTAVGFTQTAGKFVDITSAPLPLGGAARTLACLVQTSLNFRQGFLGYGAAGANGAFNLEYLQGGPGLSLIGYGVGDLYAWDGAALVDGVRHSIVATYDGTTVRLYRDGAQVAWGVRSLNTVSVGEASIGRQSYPDYPDGQITYYETNGAVDEPAAWDRALTPAEIAGLYAVGMGR